MAEKILENRVCENCGAEVRPNALFCYNCGSQVASDEEVEAENQNAKKISDAWFKESIAPAVAGDVQTLTKKKTKTVAEKEEAAAIPKPPVSLNDKETTGKVLSKPETAKSEPLKTAASLRNKQKLPEKKRVEVKWESHENAPNVWFLVVALLLTIFAVSILFAMLYIR